VKIKNPVKKWAKELKTYFTKEGIQMADKHMESCITLLTRRGILIKIIVVQLSE
jgi:hypothetical protein